LSVVTARINYWRPLAEDQGRQIGLLLPKGAVRVGLSALELGDVVDILIDNIFAHTPEGTAFRLELVAAAATATLVVADAGPGFPTERGEPRPGTSGMGLRIARRLVARAHGTLATSAAGAGGSEVRIELPLVGG
jgi:signal transduction histidine kinase